MSGSARFALLRLLLVVALVSAFGAGTAARADRSDTWTIALAGDLIYDGFVRRSVRRHARRASEVRALNALLAPIAATMRGADWAALNLESPIAERRNVRDAEHDIPTFSAPRGLAAALARAGVDGVTLGNNHALDQDRRGLGETMDALRSAGVAMAGVGVDAASARAATIVTLESGLRIALLSYSEGQNRRPPEGTPTVATYADDMAAEIRAARPRADLVIVAPHAVDHATFEPREADRARAEAAIAAGADIVMGHGPHVIRPAEWVSAGGRGGLVFHSLGNLLGVMRRPDAEVNAPRPGVRDAPIVLVRVARDGRRVRATGYRVVPHFVDHDVRRGGHVSLRPLVGLAGERGCDRRCRSMARRLHAMDDVLAPRWGDAP